MNTTLLRIYLQRAALLLATLALPLDSGVAQTTAFTYQGHLNSASGAANGWYDLRLEVWDLGAGGNKWGPTLTNAAVAVTNGLFTTTIDFGLGVFTGGSRWMQMSVRTNGSGAFTTLAPRQPVTPTPYAIYANSAAIAGNISGTLPAGGLAGLYTGAVNFSNAGNAFSGNGSGLTAVNAALLGGVGSGGFWQTGGNGGTSSSQFLGTTDAKSLTLKVNNAVGLRLDPTTSVPNLVGGLAGFMPTFIASDVRGAVVAGGNAPAGPVSGFGGGDYHAVFDSDGTIGGGFGNKVGTDNANVEDAPFASVAGGVFNHAANYAATVAGGDGNLASGAHAAIGGGAGNSATGAQAAINGGVANGATGARGAIGGGQSNQATNTHSAVAGGGWNTAGGVSSFIGGGGGDTFGGPWPNAALGNWSAILGGWNNTASGYSSVIGGGGNNNAGGTYSVVPGGSGNVSSNYCSFAAGYSARAIHDNSFVWADNGGFASTGQNQFSVRATGGTRFATSSTADSAVAANQFIIGPNGTTSSALRLGFHGYNGISAGGVIQATDGLPAPLELNPLGGGGLMGGNWSISGSCTALSFTPTSDRNVKENFETVDPQEVLEKLAAMPITRWNFKAETGAVHVGPMAQDFREAFGLGMDDKHIATVDADGVALAAIQGLNQKLASKELELSRQRKQIGTLEDRLNQLEKLVSKLSQSK